MKGTVRVPNSARYIYGIVKGASKAQYGFHRVQGTYNESIKGTVRVLKTERHIVKGASKIQYGFYRVHTLTAIFLIYTC